MRVKDDKYETKMGIYEGSIRVYELAFFLYRLQGLIPRNTYILALKTWFFPRDTTCQSIAAQVNTMHAMSAVQYYALRCNALHCLPTTMKQFVSHRITHIHTCAQKRRAERSVNALDKDPPPPHSLLPAPKPNQPLPYPSQTGKQEKKDRRTTCDPWPHNQPAYPNKPYAV